MKFNFNLPSISKKRSELNLDHNHTMTHNFGVPQVVSVIDMIPNSDITVDLSAFTRLMPLPCPSFGGVKITHRAYFVPLEFCLRGFNNFVSFQKYPYIDSNDPSSSNSLSFFSMPRFSVYDVLCFLFETETMQNVSDQTDYIELVQSNVKHDIVINTASGLMSYRYTVKGRRLISWLSQLGYKLPAFFDGMAGSDYKSKVYSVDALFAYWKFYLDWVVPSRFVMTEPRFVKIKGILDNLEFNNSVYNLVYHPVSGDYAPNEINISDFLMVPTSFLDDDHYTTAFVTPYGVENDSSNLLNSGEIGSLLVKPNAGNRPQISTNVNFNNEASLNPNPISQLSLLSLGRLQQLVNNKKITSTNVLDFLRTNYGVSPSHDSMRLSTYLGNFDSQIMIGDIMSTATTDSSLGTTVVGQYAGKGLGGSNCKWRVRAEQHGILFITCEISTKSSYVNGVSPLRSRFTPLDFFNEKFDNVGVRAIRHDELVMNTFEEFPALVVPDLPEPNSIFGYSPRYSEYKYHDDVVSGDFMFPSVNEGLDSWYLTRKFKLTDDPKINLEFLSATSDSVGSQYDRIFQNTDNIDHFYSVYHLNVHETSIKERFLDYFKSLNETDIDKNTQDVAIN